MNQISSISTAASPDASEAMRAPVAVAASMAVMAAGAAFLTLVIWRTPPEAPPALQESAAQRVVLSIEPEEGRPSPAVPTGKASARVIAEIAAPQAAAPIASETVGLLPRLSPSRIAADESEIVDSELIPRLKPEGENATTAAIDRPPVLALGQSFIASADDNPPPFYFEADIAPETPSRAPLAIAYEGDISDGPRAVTVALTKGETFVDAMRRAGVRAADRNAAAYAFGKHQNLRTLRPGQEFVLTTAQPNQTLFQMVAEGHEPETFLLALDFKADAENIVSLKRTSDGGFDARKESVQLTTRLAAFSGRIDGSLYVSAKHVGAPDLVIASLADIFAYDVDFQREIFGGDEFEAIFEARYDERGRMVGTGDIVYARLKWRGRSKEKGYYRFATADGGARAEYFDRLGESAKRLLMKTPIDGARLSSGFGTRRHPILGYQKAHKGVDFAAARGTPIKAAGDGVVERADRYGSFGNYIRIRHANGYKTAYAHLNGFARGVRAGKRVDQGDIIGYVGTTGRSTGPHLHYEVHLNGKQVNPQKLKIATGVALKGAELDRFKARRDAIDAMRLPVEEPPSLLADAKKGKQL